MPNPKVASHTIKVKIKNQQIRLFKIYELTRTRIAKRVKANSSKKRRILISWACGLRIVKNRIPTKHEIANKFKNTKPGLIVTIVNRINKILGLRRL